MALDDRKEYGVLPTDGLPEGSYDVAGPLVFLNSLAKKVPSYKQFLDDVKVAENQGFDIWELDRAFRDPIKGELMYDTGTAYTGKTLPKYKDSEELLQDTSAMTLDDYLDDSEIKKVLGNAAKGVKIGEVEGDKLNLAGGLTIRGAPNEYTALFVGPSKNRGRLSEQEIIDHEVGHVVQEKFGMPIGTNPIIAAEWLRFLKATGRISDEVYLNATRTRNPQESLTGDFDYDEGYRTSMGEAYARAGANITQTGQRPRLSDFAEQGFPIKREDMWEFYNEDVNKARDWRVNRGGALWNFKP
jgi:hypothetical protein|tara:strand:- start:1543 stop:2442 length:900 start_codon:yes stop_codon:yes gene_type:complete